MLGLARAKTLSYSAVKLFSNYSYLCETYLNTTNRQTDNLVLHHHAMRNSK